MKIGVIGIIIERNKEVVQAVQALLSDNADIILGRMGIPDKVSGVSVISLIVKATNERISALTGKLGRLKSVKVKSAVTETESIVG
ncbi:MAG: CopG family transcriptional regulator [Clostridia bacterium]|nr:CopG family transcriptional regulator [Clostridia bacterium]